VVEGCYDKTFGQSPGKGETFSYRTKPPIEEIPKVSNLNNH